MFLNIELVYFKMLHCCRLYLRILKKPIFKTYTHKLMILNIDSELKLSNYTSWTRFVCLKRYLKKSFTILYFSSTTIHCQSIPLHFSSTTKHCQSIPLKCWSLSIRLTNPLTTIVHENITTIFFLFRKKTRLTTI